MSHSKLSSVLAAVALTCATAATVHADPDAGEHVPHAHSRAKAFAASLVGTAVSVAAIGSGFLLLNASTSSNGNGAGLILSGAGFASLIVTPSLGHAYGDHHLVTAGMATRLVGTAALAVGTAALIATVFNASACGGNLDNGGGNGGACTDSNTNASSVATVFLIGGSALILGGTIYDIATAARSADRWNAEHGFAIDAHVTPTVMKTAAGETIPAFGIVGSF